MNCPVCNRNNAVTLSICPSCGAMINDSVREELKPITSQLTKPANFEVKGSSSTPNKLNQQIVIAESTKTEIASKSNTGKLEIKAANQTLIEFHNKNAAVPEWRLQLQNAVRKRQDRNETDAAPANAPFVAQTKLVTNGANALKAEIVEENEPRQHKNPTLNSALQRIEKSRRRFLTEEKTETAPNARAAKNYPFYIASKQTEVAPSSDADALVNPPVRPKLAASLRIEDGKPLDTNKLPPLPQSAKISENLTNPPAETIENAAAKEIGEIKEREIKFVETAEREENVLKSEFKVEKADEIEEIEETDDLAPFSMRFNAGLFDLIIGSFASLILLSPFMIRSEGWFTISGFFAFLAICAVVMFAYLTVAIGFYGKTFGMRLFSLEVIDIDGETYPTMHQAAVSSSVYLLSLAFGGIGFLTLLFNEEKRAVHDLVSKTIIVKEF